MTKRLASEPILYERPSGEFESLKRFAMAVTPFFDNMPIAQQQEWTTAWTRFEERLDAFVESTDRFLDSLKGYMQDDHRRRFEASQEEDRRAEEEEDRRRAENAWRGIDVEAIRAVYRAERERQIHIDNEPPVNEPRVNGRHHNVLREIVVSDTEHIDGIDGFDDDDGYGGYVEMDKENTRNENPARGW